MAELLDGIDPIERKDKRDLIGELVANISLNIGRKTLPRLLVHRDLPTYVDDECFFDSSSDEGQIWAKKRRKKEDHIQPYLQESESRQTDYFFTRFTIIHNQSLVGWLVGRSLHVQFSFEMVDFCFLSFLVFGSIYQTDMQLTRTKSIITKWSTFLPLKPMMTRENETTNYAKFFFVCLCLFTLDQKIVWSRSFGDKFHCKWPLSLDSGRPHTQTLRKRKKFDTKMPSDKPLFCTINFSQLKKRPSATKQAQL